MKKLSALLFQFLLFPLFSFGQFTFTNANMVPKPGESYTLNIVNYMSAGAGGANETWDFSNLTSQNSVTYHYVNANTLPHYNTFSNANAGYGSPGQPYEYISNSNAKYSREGVVSPNGVVVKYDDPQDLARFPMVFNDSYTDNFGGTFVSNGVTFVRSGTITTTVDGYGTLTLPFGTFNNVMRIRYEEDYRDDFNAGGGPDELEYNSLIYAWYKEGTKLPILSFSQLLSDVGNSQYGFLHDPGNVGMNRNIVSDNLNVYPNPATQAANIEFTLSNAASGSISIFNQLGAKVLHIEQNTFAAGKNAIIVSLDDLSAGSYFVQVKMAEDLINKPLMVIK